MLTEIEGDCPRSKGGIKKVVLRFGLTSRQQSPAALPLVRRNRANPAGMQILRSFVRWEATRQTTYFEITLLKALANKNNLPTDKGRMMPKWLELVYEQPVLVAALAFGFFTGFYNFIQEDIVITGLVVFATSGMLGFVKPKRAWLWAGIIGISIPISNALGMLIDIDAPLVRIARENASTEAAFAGLSVLLSLLVVFLAESTAAIGLLARKTLSRLTTNGQ